MKNELVFDFTFLVPEHVQKDVPNCIAEREKASGTMLVGAYIPQCTDDGHYQQIQIHGSTGESWCVHNVTGIKIEGTEKSRIEGSAVCPSELKTWLTTENRSFSYLKRWVD